MIEKYSFHFLKKHTRYIKEKRSKFLLKKMIS
jgi:hypothetical protein